MRSTRLLRGAANLSGAAKFIPKHFTPSTAPSAPLSPRCASTSEFLYAQILTFYTRLGSPYPYPSPPPPAAGPYFSNPPLRQRHFIPRRVESRRRSPAASVCQHGTANCRNAETVVTSVATTRLGKI